MVEPDPKPYRPTLGSVAATLWYWAVFVPTISFGFCLLMVLFGVTAPFDKQRKAVHRFVNDWMHTYLKIWPGWRVRIKGTEHIPVGVPSVLVANHQSVADVLACMGIRRQFKFVAKGSLFTLPIVGWGMKMMRYVSVERGRPRSMHHMIEECRGWLRQGMSVLIFPEGTYASARELLPFKRGAFKLAIEEKAPVVPIAVRGTRSLVVEDGPWMSPRADIEIEVLPPIMPAELGTDEKAAAERVRIVLSEAVGRPDAAPVQGPAQ